MEEYIGLISNVGFPIAITFYVLFRLEKTINSNTQALHNMMEVMKSCLIKLK